MKNEYVVSQKVYVSWTKENMKRGGMLASSIIWGVAAVSVLIMGAVKTTMLPLCVMLAALCVYQALFEAPRQAGKQYDKQAEVYGMTNWTRCVELREEDILITEVDESVNWPYGKITSVQEMKGYALIVFDGRVAIRLYDDAYVSGDWAACRELIERKRQEALLAGETYEDEEEEYEAEEEYESEEEEYEDEEDSDGDKPAEN